MAREQTRDFPTTRTRAEWVEREREAPTEVTPGIWRFVYELYESQEERVRVGGRPFFITNHLAQLRENHQRIVRGPNGGLMHVTAGEVLPDDLETFIESDPRYFRWTGVHASGDWITSDRPARRLAPFIFPAAPWAGGQNEELDPQWVRETYTLPIADQVAECKRRRLDRAERKQESGDKRGTTINLQVSASTDDADQIGTSVFTNFGSSLVDATTEHFGMRWDGVTIEPGATVDDATLSVHMSTATGDEPKVQLRGEASADAATFSTGTNNINGRTRTTATIQWNSTNLGVPGSPGDFEEWGCSASGGAGVSIAAIVQEIIDGGSWASGNAIVMIYEQHTADEGVRDLGVNTYDSDSARAALLDIDYTAGGGDIVENATPILASVAFGAVANSLINAVSPLLARAAFTTPANALSNSVSPVLVETTFQQSLAELLRTETAIPITVQAAFNTPNALLTNILAAIGVQVISVAPASLLSQELTPLVVLVTMPQVDFLLATITENATPILVAAAFQPVSTLLSNAVSPMAVQVLSITPSQLLTALQAALSVEVTSIAPSQLLSQTISALLVQATSITPGSLLNQSLSPISVLVSMNQAGFSIAEIIENATSILVQSNFGTIATLLDNPIAAILARTSFGTISSSLENAVAAMLVQAASVAPGQLITPQATPLLVRASLNIPSELLNYSSLPIQIQTAFGTILSSLNKDVTPISVILSMPQSTFLVTGIEELASPILIVVSMPSVTFASYELVTAIIQGLIELEDLIDRQIWPDNVSPSGYDDPVEETLPSGFIKNPSGTNLWDF